MTYMTTRHTEAHTTRYGRETTRRVTTEWHYPVTEDEARATIERDHNGWNVSVLTVATV